MKPAAHKTLSEAVRVHQDDSHWTLFISKRATVIEKAVFEQYRVHGKCEKRIQNTSFAKQSSPSVQGPTQTVFFHPLQVSFLSDFFWTQYVILLENWIWIPIVRDHRLEVFA